MVQLIDKTKKKTEVDFGDILYGQAFLGKDDVIYLKTSEKTAVRWSEKVGGWMHATISAKGEPVQYSFDFDSPVIPYKTTITIEKA